MKERYARPALAALLLAVGCNLAAAAPVTYTITSTGAAEGGPSGHGIRAPDLSLFTGGVQATFIYDSAAERNRNPDGTPLVLADGSFLYRGSNPQSLTGFVTSLSDLSGTVGGMPFADVSGSTLVGDDKFPGMGERVDVFQFLFEPGLATPATAQRNLTGLDLPGFDLVNLRVFWIENHPDLTLGEFLSNQELLASPPSVTGRLVFDFIEVGNPAATSFVFFDVNVAPLTAIPEPHTYAMLLAGLGLLGFAALRRFGV